MSADGTISWILEIMVRKRFILSFTSEASSAQKEPQDCLSSLVGVGRSLSCYWKLSATPSLRGCPDITPAGALQPLSCPALGAFPAVPASQLSRRVEAFPRGLEAPACSSLRPLGRHSPISDFPSGHCWSALPSLCVFSLWVGAWELETLLTSSPHPPFGGPNSLG